MIQQSQQPMRRLVLATVFVLAWTQAGGCPLVTSLITPGVRVKTSLGEFVIELDPESAPVTVANFLQYVDDGFYDGTIFHRVVPEFVIQGGGLQADLVEKTTRPPIPNESDNGLSNVRGTVAMARMNDPNSATAQFFINLVDNPVLDATADRLGYTVFGRVIEGTDVIDQIAAVKTGERDGLTDVPVEDVVIEDIERIDLPTGELELTPEGEEYLEAQGLRVLTLLRELAVQLVAFGIRGAVG